MRFILVLTVLSFSTAAFADKVDSEGRRIVYKEKTEIDFEGLDLKGELVKPQGILMLDRKRASFNPLIRLRADFDEEMAESVDEVK
jgi:hypothetical protein|tara:strand:+ start:264 stop:521 length:258 start_codon:yes stop_codon:yes gene_type:complete